MTMDIIDNSQVLNMIEKTVTKQLEILNRDIDSVKTAPKTDQINLLLLVEPRIEAVKSSLDDDQLGNDGLSGENRGKINELRQNVDSIFDRFQKQLETLKSEHN
uniref:Uncharacterized protein n=1 Tax=Panagrolaimus sp. JU765 TaxID=591449 RepID=A0AC34QV99_9BILA